MTKAILIVDDDALDRELFIKWLENFYIPIKIIEATNGQEACEAFLKHRPDCILLDFLMARETGFDLLAMFANSSHKVPPIAFITAFHEPALEEDAKELGAVLYLNKNALTKEIFVGAIQQMLKQHE